jgi:16S rRNA (cytosine1402-N4)-methyltransferase
MHANRTAHAPVMLNETLAALRLVPNGIYVDATIGAGGHASGILERSSPGGRLLGLDADPEALKAAESRLIPFRGRYTLVNANFSNIRRVAAANGFDRVDGVLMDLGLSSLQLADSTRGFSFSLDSCLDMRFGPDQALTASSIVNDYEERDIADLLWMYGQEPASRRIARAIAEARSTSPILTSGRLSGIIEQAVGGRRGKIHPATRTFQALRIAVNSELESLDKGLAGALELLKPGGRLAVISFHSLEDRIVKRFLLQEAAGCTCPPRTPVCNCGHVSRVIRITKKAVTATFEEVHQNPRSRSGKLRVGERVA